MLVILSGLPGSGKTTISRILCRRLGALHVRIDTIEQALISLYGANDPVDAAGYIIAYRLAEDNLRVGATVIADSVNPVAITRQAWRNVAVSANAATLEIEVVCSDAVEHRRRIETRSSDIDGQVMPRWSDVRKRDYEPWDAEVLTVDTSKLTAEECTAAITAALASLV